MYPDALVWEGFHKATDSRNAGRIFVNRTSLARH